MMASVPDAPSQQSPGWPGRPQRRGQSGGSPPAILGLDTPSQRAPKKALLRPRPASLPRGSTQVYPYFPLRVMGLDADEIVAAVDTHVSPCVWSGPTGEPATAGPSQKRDTADPSNLESWLDMPLGLQQPPPPVEMPTLGALVPSLLEDDYWRRARGRPGLAAAAAEPEVAACGDAGEEQVAATTVAAAGEEQVAATTVAAAGERAASAKRQRTDGPARGASTRTSTYCGVTWCKHTGQWRAQIRYQGRNQHLGRFADESDAARAYDARARQLHGASARLNFPGEGERQGTAVQRVDPQVKATNAAAVAIRQRQQGCTSAYRGVSWSKHAGQWCVTIMHQGREHYLGCFADEGDAARAYDARARQLRGASARLNFPGEGERQGRARQRVDPQARAASAAVVAIRQRQQRCTSAYRGVSWSKQHGQWCATIMHQGRNQHLGCFADEGDAARAYDARARQLHGASARLNFPGEGERQGRAVQRVNPPSHSSAARTPRRD
eukprot:COSAG01_NODE_49_length_31891_cov_29.945773_27_plen_497_part_00